MDYYVKEFFDSQSKCKKPFFRKNNKTQTKQRGQYLRFIYDVGNYQKLFIVAADLIDLNFSFFFLGDSDPSKSTENFFLGALVISSIVPSSRLIFTYYSLKV